MKTLTSLGLALVLVLWPGLGRAQQPQPPQQEQEEELGPVVVTATRVATPLELLPFSAEVISEEDLDEKQASSVKEALRTARGLHVVQTGRSGGTTSVFLRGGESDHTLILLDGIPLNDDGGFYNWVDLTVDNVERIEVFRGAGSSLYGSSALSGVIQIITREGEGPPRLSVSTAFGDQGSSLHRATLQGSRPGVRYSLALSRYDTDGVFEPNDFYGLTTATGKLTFALTDYSQAVLTAHYLDARKGVPGQTGLFVFDRNAFSELDQVALGLTLTQEVFPWFDHAVFLALLDRDRFDQDPIADPPSLARRPEASAIQTTVYDFTSQDFEDFQRRLADYHFNLRGEALGVEAVFTGGFEWEIEDGKEGGATGITFNDERRNRAYYTQAQLNWRDRVIVVPGVRFEDNQVFGGETIPRVAGAVILGDKPEKTWVGPLKLKASYGHGIKEPSFFESFNPTYGNPGLGPEETIHWDSGLELTLCRGRCFFEAIYFHIHQKNKIDFQNNTFINIGKARSHGIEIYGALEPFGWLWVEGQYTGLETVIKESPNPLSETSGVGKELLRRPKHSGAGSVIGLFGPLTVRGDVIVVGDRFDSDFVFPTDLDIFENPGYTRVDLSARIRLENTLFKLWGSAFPHSVEAFGRVENLLDEDYEEVIGYPSTGITFLAGLQVTFQGAEREEAPAEKQEKHY